MERIAGIDLTGPDVDLLLDALAALALRGRRDEILEFISRHSLLQTLHDEPPAEEDR